MLQSTAAMSLHFKLIFRTLIRLSYLLEDATDINVLRFQKRSCHQAFNIVMPRNILVIYKLVMRRSVDMFLIRSNDISS